MVVRCITGIVLTLLSRVISNSGPLHQAGVPYFRVRGNDLLWHLNMLFLCMHRASETMASLATAQLHKVRAEELFSRSNLRVILISLSTTGHANHEGC